MPMRRKDYPEDWEAISLAVRERAGWRCETCGVPNNMIICRLKRDPFRWRECAYGEAEEWAAAGKWRDTDWLRPVRVVLTVHHRGVPYPDGRPGDPHDKLDVRPENLAALCQRCHLCEDIKLHMTNAKRTRIRKRDERRRQAGQAELWEL